MNTEQHRTTQFVADLRTEIVRADTKASILIAAMSLTFGSTAGLVTSLCWLAALLSLLMVLIPRYRSGPWMADPKRHLASDERSTLLTTADDLSRIVVLKYRWTKISLACFATGAATATLCTLLK